jgi:hypothetical protein
MENSILKIFGSMDVNIIPGLLFLKKLLIFKFFKFNNLRGR